MIPERVYKTYTSATFKKNKTKKYNNSFGLYLYQDIPEQVYCLGVKTMQEDGYSYQIATPEKAVCNKLYSLKSVYILHDLRDMLFEDLRIDEDKF